MDGRRVGGLCRCGASVDEETGHSCAGLLRLLDGSQSAERLALRGGEALCQLSRHPAKEAAQDKPDGDQRVVEQVAVHRFITACSCWAHREAPADALWA